MIAVYRPHPQKESELLDLLKKHVPILQREGLVTSRSALILRSKLDATHLEIFEWRSPELAAAAHSNDRVKEIWEALAEVAEMTTLSALKESGQRFPHFDVINLPE
jgi:hypothetical protein